MERFKNQTIDKLKIEEPDEYGASRHNGGLNRSKTRCYRSPEIARNAPKNSSLLISRFCPVFITIQVPHGRALYPHGRALFSAIWWRHLIRIRFWNWHGHAKYWHGRAWSRRAGTGDRTGSAHEETEPARPCHPAARPCASRNRLAPGPARSGQPCNLAWHGRAKCLHGRALSESSQKICNFAVSPEKSLFSASSRSARCLRPVNKNAHD